jgi:hypothetical protein
VLFDLVCLFGRGDLGCVAFVDWVGNDAHWVDTNKPMGFVPFPGSWWPPDVPYCKNIMGDGDVTRKTLDRVGRDTAKGY